MKGDTLNLRNGVGGWGIMGNGDYDDIVGKVHSFWEEKLDHSCPPGTGVSSLPWQP